MQEPLDAPEAKRLIRQILASGQISFSKHALEEAAKDDLGTPDALNVLRGGTVDPAELENGTWRYRVRTAAMCVVIAFRSETELRVVTLWRFK